MTCIQDVQDALGDLCFGTGIQNATADIAGVRGALAVGWVPHLSKREREIYKDCRILKRQADWIAGRLAARRAVAKLLGCRQEIIEVDRCPTGAPAITGWNGHISISHSGTVAAAVAASFPVGIDLEQDETHPEALVRAVMCDSEQRLLDRYTQDRRRTEVIRLWTCKEAVAKVGGWGGSMDFKRLDCSDESTTVDKTIIRHRSRLTPKYVVTLAYNDGAQPWMKVARASSTAW